MGKKTRRGSSTRKYKVDNDLYRNMPASRPKSKKETKVKGLPIVKQVAPVTDKRAMIVRFEAQIRSGKNSITGKPLTDKEIGVFLTCISSLEHQLGIKHYQ